jgi:hypothetical protein
MSSKYFSKHIDTKQDIENNSTAISTRTNQKRVNQPIKTGREK